MRKGNVAREASVEMETASFAKRLYEKLKEAVSERKIETELILDKSLPGALQADEGFLTQTFSFLFAHCAQATEKEIVCLSIRGMDMEEGGYVLRISVYEGGNGFTEEQLEQFHRRKDNCEEQYLSRLFAIKKETEARDGVFSIYSAYGSGALYYMILPCRILKAAAIGELEDGKQDGLHNVEHGETESKAGEIKTKWIDREVALTYSGGMEEMRLEMLSIYYEQAKQYLNELPSLFQTENWEKYRIVVHAIKGNSLGIGAEGFSKEAYEQEMAAKNGDIQKIKAEFETFYAHYQSLLEEVERCKIR